MKLYALSTDEFDSLHLVMEFMPGGCLHSLLENKDIPIPFEQAFGYIQQSAAAISYIHSQGKLHRDIKPLNMLLSADQRVLKLGDFGSVRDLQNSMTSQKGTVLYMAPEVFNGKHYNEKCDVYSWAISMWHVLSRLIPFINFNLRNLMKAIQNGERPKLEDISYVECTDRLKQLIASCWQGEASIRPAMSDVLVTLESCR
ncbi:mitogen-activated protein kinase kinase kinase 7 [Drosophila busckii]|nr:mitogen-activated protein kinase kinase kinase 7 [Drosophila busckii]